MKLNEEYSEVFNEKDELFQLLYEIVCEAVECYNEGNDVMQVSFPEYEVMIIKKENKDDNEYN